MSCWRLLTQDQKKSDTVWCWLPGWGFKPEVFEHLYNDLPGQHWGMDFPTEKISRDKLTDQLINRAPDNAIWVGWSLGGALAMLAAEKKPTLAKKIITLATGKSFLKPQGEHYGMDNETYFAFKALLNENANKTRKRFLALCCQGHPDQRLVSKLLSNHQLTDADQLIHTLCWLENYKLMPNKEYSQQHFVGDHDALNPGGLNAEVMAKSHAFWFNNPTLAERLQGFGNE